MPPAGIARISHYVMINTELTAIIILFHVMQVLITTIARRAQSDSNCTGLALTAVIQNYYVQTMV